MRWLPPTLPTLIALVWCATPSGRVAAQVAGEAASISWEPATPLQGSLIVVVVRPGAGDSVLTVRGDVAGEPLHELGLAGTHRAADADLDGLRHILLQTYLRYNSVSS